MKASRTALGVAPGREQVNFVFGGLSKASGVPFNLAPDLKQIESIVQQHLDFIQKLYFEQSYLGEYFDEIHLGVMAEPASPSSGEQQLQVLLAERIKQWIVVDQLNLVLTQHTGISIRAQAKYLGVNNAVPESLNNDASGMADAFTIWSFIFSEASDVYKRRVFKKIQPVYYADMSRGIADHYLDRYKNDTIASFSKTNFQDPAIEKVRQRLLELSNIGQTGKHELLLCRERILNLLEQQSAQQALAARTQVSIVGNDGHVELAAPVVDKPEPPVLRRPKVPEPPVQEPDWSAAASRTDSGTDSGKDSGSNSGTDFFSTPQFAISENPAPVESSGKTWHEPNARKKIRTDAWMFRIVFVLVLAGLIYMAKGM